MRRNLALVAFVLFLVPALPTELCATLSLSTNTLRFTGAAGASINPQIVHLIFRDFSGTPVPFPWTSGPSTRPPWVSLSPQSGTTPTDVTVSVNTTGLAPGTYNTNIVFSASTSSPNLDIELTVTAALVCSGITVRPDRINKILDNDDEPFEVHCPVTSSQPTAPAIDTAATVTELAEANIAWNTTIEYLTGSNWLSLSPSSGTAVVGSPNRGRIRINRSAISAAGVYQAIIHFRETAGGRTVRLPIAITVPGAPVLLVSQNAFVFTTASNSPRAAASQILRFLTRQSSLSWTLTGLPPWLTASSTSGTATTTPSSIQLTANATGMGSGAYQSLLTIAAPGGVNSTELVAVTLHVVPSATPATPLIQPTALAFVSIQGQPAPATQSLTFSNTGGSNYSFSLTPSTSMGGSWLSATPSGGDTSAGPAIVQVRVNSVGLGQGRYRGKLVVTIAPGSPLEVEVLLIVAPPAVAISAACTPTALEMLGTSVSNATTLAVSFPRILQALVLDDCGNNVSTASVLANVPEGGIALRSLGAGLYTGTWVPARAAANVTLELAATHATLSSTTRQYTVATAAAPGAVELPLLGDGGVVDGAAFARGRPLVPGQIVSLFGERLAASTATAQRVPLDRELSSVSVRIGSLAAPLYFVSAGQINAQVPFEAPPGATVTILVNSAGRLTLPQTYQIASGQPAIFLIGPTQPAITDANGAVISSQNPARIGGALIIYATGLGLTDVALESGAAASGLSTLRTPVTVTVGGVQANVLYQGFAPGFVGLYQINIIVPSGVTAGSAVPIVVTQGGVTNNGGETLTIPVATP